MILSMITLRRCLEIVMSGHDKLCPDKDADTSPTICFYCSILLDARINGYNSGYKDGHADALEGEV
jgi:hypothetical protein